MNPKFMNAPEREAYRMGYERGKQEGLQKAAMLIQLVASDSAAFKENILQNSKTITSMEAAEWCGKEHAKLLRDIRKYTEQLGEAKIGFTDFFKESTYVTDQNKTLPCFLVTKKGCEFIAHKMTGQKGTEFTARYINRFHEMEEMPQRLLTEHPGEVAKLIQALASRMDKQGSAPYKSAEMAKLICEQYGIRLPVDFVKVPEYEQISLFGNAD